MKKIKREKVRYPAYLTYEQGIYSYTYGSYTIHGSLYNIDAQLSFDRTLIAPIILNIQDTKIKTLVEKWIDTKGYIIVE